jgi:hypothetical protein
VCVQEPCFYLLWPPSVVIGNTNHLVPVLPSNSCHIDHSHASVSFLPQPSRICTLLSVHGNFSLSENFLENREFSRQYFFSKYFGKPFTQVFRFQAYSQNSAIKNLKFSRNIRFLDIIALSCPCCHVLIVQPDDFI